MLYRGLRKQGVLAHSPGWRRLWMQSIAGNVVMVAFLWWFSRDAQYWIEMRALARAWHMGLLVAGGAVCYFGTMALLGLKVRDLRVKAVSLPPAAHASAGSSDGTGSGSA